MKKIIAILFLILVALWEVDAASTEEIVNAIKSNPALLDTPQAQKMMRDKGLSKEDILKKVDQKDKNASQPTNQKDANLSITTQRYINTPPDVNATADTAIVDQNISQEDLINNMLKNPLTFEQPNDRFKRLLTQQIKERFVPLKRYGESFFTNNNGIDLSSLPVPDAYRLSANDNLSITLFGPRSDAMSPVVDRDGNILLPSFGPLHVAGLTFVEAKKVISSALIQAYPNVGVVVTISKFSTIQVTLAGEITAPGVYNVTSFSTVKDALIVAGGISENGSMRAVQVKRGNRIIKTVDLYGTIRNGDKRQEVLLQAGDVIVVPMVKKTISIEGGVKHPAIYEPKGDETLADILQYAGGLSAQSSKYDIKLTRYSNNEKMEILTINASDAKTTKLKDQDKIYVYDMAGANIRSVMLYGNVVKPGSRALGKKNMTITELLAPEIRQQTMKGVFLEQTLFDYAMIKRIDENLKETAIGFSLTDALSGKEKVVLHNRDEIYILNIASVRPIAKVSISGECVAKPAEYKYIDNMGVKDLINAAGVSCVPDYTHVQVVSYDKVTNRPIIKNIDLSKEPLAKLSDLDEVTLFSCYMANPIHKIKINGEVNRPDEYPIGDETTLRNVILAAGGLTEKADQKMEIVRFSLKDGRRVSSIIALSTSEAMSDKSPKVMAYDEINIFAIPSWRERRSVKLIGKVRYPGEYVIQDGEKLSDVLARAGGFTDQAFLDGSVFTRADIKKIQEDAIRSQIQELEHKATIIAATPKSSSVGNVASSDNSSLVAMIASLKEQAKMLDIPGRMVIRLDSDPEKLAKSQYNILLKDGDALYVPEREDSVVVVGEVMNPSAIFHSTNDAETYIDRSGGIKESADLSGAFIIHANGEAEKVSKGLFSANAKVGPGDSIVVPIKLDSYPTMLFVKDISSIIYQFAISVAALKTIGAI